MLINEQSGNLVFDDSASHDDGLEKGRDEVVLQGSSQRRGEMICPTWQENFL